MKFLGVKKIASTFDFKFNTQQSTGAPITLSDAGVIVYKSNSTTESSSGVTLTKDFDSRVGCHHVRIDTSADSSFYTSDNDYQVVISSGLVDSISVSGTVLAHFSLGNVPANLKQIDEFATSGNNATLFLKQLHISNSGGTAIVATSTGSNGHGASFTGQGSGEGMSIVGGSSGFGIEITGVGGISIAAGGGNNAGINVSGFGSGAGIRTTGGSTGVGMNITGGASGVGLLINSNSSHAIVCTASSTGSGMRLVGGDTGNGITIVGGATTGNGINISTTDGHGVNIVGGGANVGLRVMAGATGVGFQIIGGATSGNGLQISAPGSSGHGIFVTSGGNDEAMQLTGSGSGAGVIITGGDTGHGIQISAGATSGDGIIAIGTGAGVDIRGDITGNITGGISNPVAVSGTVSANIVEISGSAPAAHILASQLLTVQVLEVRPSGGNSETRFLTNLSGFGTGFFGNANGGNVLVWLNSAANKYQARRIVDSNNDGIIEVESALSVIPSGADRAVLLGRIEV